MMVLSNPAACGPKAADAVPPPPLGRTPTTPMHPCSSAPSLAPCFRRPPGQQANIIIEKQAELGNKWAAIAKYLPGGSPRHVRSVSGLGVARGGRGRRPG